MQITEIQEGPYLIKVGQLGGQWVARAFPKPPAQTPGMIEEGAGKSSDDALTDLREKLQPPQRRPHPGAGFDVPTADEYTRAVRQVKLTKPQTTMLLAHANSGEDGMTATEIAQAGGYTRHSTANSMYGRAGRMIAEYLEADPPKNTAGDADVWTGALAWQSPHRADEEHWVWVMHEELREAVETVMGSAPKR